MPRTPRLVRHFTFRLCFLFAVLALGIALFAANGLAAQGRPSWVEGELLIGFHPGVSRGQAEAVYKPHGAQLIEEIPQIRVHRIKVAPAAFAAVEQALSRLPAVRFVDRNVILFVEGTPNDPSYVNQWHHPKIGSPQAWDITTGAAAIVIAILDTGVDGSHPDLAANIIPGYNVYNNTSDWTDVHGHGTKVAGTAAAIGNNATGVAGVSWQSRIMPIRVTDSSGYAYYSTIAKGLTWAADNGAKVMNISISGVAGSSTIKSAAQYAVSKGAVVVAGAGNCGCLDATLDNPYIISVSATDSNDNLASFSSRGSYVDVAAPGTGILTTTRGGGYGSVSGTSFSGPIAAGVVALMMAAKPGLPLNTYEDLLKKTADDRGEVGYDTSFGWGRLNAAQAVAAAAGSSPALDTIAPSAKIDAPTSNTKVSATVKVDVSATDNAGVNRVDLYVDGALFASATGAPYSFFWDTTKAGNGTHSLTAKALDTAGNVGTSTAVNVSVENVTDMTAPTAAITSVTETKQTLKVHVDAQDDVGVVKVELYLDGGLVATDTSAAYDFSVNIRKISAGTHNLEARAYDASGKVGVSLQKTFTK